MATYKVSAKEKAATEAATRKGLLPSEGYTAQSLPHILNTFDMTTIYVMIIFYITNATTAISGGAATFTYWLLAGVTFFIPCVIATAQLGVMFPNEGALYNWTHKVIGGYWSFFVAFCAWFPGVLVMVGGADVIVSHLQGLNPQWLTAPWQQGIVLIVVVILSGFIAVQRFRTVQNVVNVVVCLLFVSVLLIGIAGVTWLVTGHPSATSFNHLSDWFIKVGDVKNPGNLAVFGLVTFAYIGMEVPLNMGGETTGLHVIKRHLLWGTLLVIIGYLTATFTLLVVQGPAAAGNTFAIVSSVDMVLGKGVGNIVAVCIMASFVLAVVVYNYAYARLLFVAGVDQRLPMNIGKLNKNRVPSNAIKFQTAIAVVFTILAFMVVPYLIHIGNPADLSNEVYNVSQAAATLVWVVSTAFLLINLGVLFLRNQPLLKAHHVVPIPLLWLCIIVGTIASILGVVDTLLNSWIAQQISNDQWRYIVGGITLLCIIIAAVGSMLANSEASWEGFSE